MDDYYPMDEDNVHQKRGSHPGNLNRNRDGASPANSERSDHKLATTAKKKTWKKPKGMPKRPMSGYNLFFQLERERLLSGQGERLFTREDVDRIADAQKLKDMSAQPKRKHRKSHGKLGFAELARMTAAAWKALGKDAKAVFEERAAIEKEEYKRALKIWTANTKKSSPIAKDSSAAPAADAYSPIPLKPPKPIVADRQFVSEGLRDDLHYSKPREAPIDLAPAHEPMFEKESSHQSEIHSRPSLGSQAGSTYQERLTNPYSQSPMVASKKTTVPPTGIHSSERGFHSNAAFEAAYRNARPHGFRRQSAAHFTPRDAELEPLPNMHYQARYRRQSTPEYSTTPLSTEVVQTHSTGRRNFSVTQNAVTQQGETMTGRLFPGTYFTGYDRNTPGRASWDQHFVPPRASIPRPESQTFPIVRLPPQNLPIVPSASTQPGLTYRPEADDIQEPALQVAIATAEEGPETLEEEEEMNRLLNSYEC